MAAILYEVEPLAEPARIFVQSALVANEAGPEQTDDPRAAAALQAPLSGEQHRHAALRATLVHRAQGSGLRIAAFWDMEASTLPVLTYVAPETARDALRWRHSTIDLAQARAGELGLDGSAFPWRTIRGQECSGYWPASTAAFHINADIAEPRRRRRDESRPGAIARPKSAWWLWHARPTSA